MTSPVNIWEQELLAVHSRLASLFRTAASQQHCLDYLRGLLSDVERNLWSLYERIPFARQKSC
ncbi:hypothetical protein ACNFJN_12350 [Xenorhabdus budapestensis]|uniref:hypothetical protein n=1 Tax=Xenorhabdus budapestensis TaxID=290110 RepID=UPI003A8497CA